MIRTAESLREYVEAQRARVDAALEQYLPSTPACPALLSEAMRYSLFAGGKRLRPILALASAEALGGDVALALPVACAVELIHTYSLVHDDLPSMDNDTLRRGRPTLHVVYGDGLAILAGDALQAEAFALVAREPTGDDGEVARRKVRALQLLAEAAGAGGMVGGQTLDLQAAGQTSGPRLLLDAEGLGGMHARKTGALIHAAAVCGAVMGGGSPDMIAAIGRWATQVGLAFQIVDDILDVEGDAAQLGKTAGKDAAAEKPTYPSVFGLNRSKAMAVECGERARAILADAGLTDGWLIPIADWVIHRRS